MSARLTINQAATAFGVTTMTIFSWRKGIAGRAPLPVEIDNPEAIKPRVFVPIAKAKAWAEKYNLAFAPDSIETAGRHTKGGPKPTTEPEPRTRKARATH